MAMADPAPTPRPAFRRGAVQAVIAVHSRVRVASWRDAIRTAARPLVETGAVTPHYVDRCVQMVEEQGPYIVVAPGTALAHARPSDGANTLALGLARLASPIRFDHGGHDPVRLVFVFAAPREDQHVMLLGRLARALPDGLGTKLESERTDAGALRILEEVVEGGA